MLRVVGDWCFEHVDACALAYDALLFRLLG